VAWLTVLLVLFIVFEIGWAAAPAIKRYGLGFLTGVKWDPNTQEYGIRPHIWGTLYSSVVAVIIGTVLGLSVAIFLSERFLSSFVYTILKLFGVQHHSFWGKLP
jgi:phosphate transport system permease protein